MLVYVNCVLLICELYMLFYTVKAIYYGDQSQSKLLTSEIINYQQL